MPDLAEYQINNEFPLAEYIIGVRKEFNAIHGKDVYYVTYMFDNNRGYSLVVNTNLYVISGMEAVFNNDCLMAFVGNPDERRYDMNSYLDYDDLTYILKAVQRLDNVDQNVVTNVLKLYFFDPKV